VSQTKNLVALNSELTQDLLVKHCKDKQLAAINQLAAFPNIQYDFLKQMVNNHDFSELDSDVKLVYLNTMCQIDFYEVPKEIRKRDFPLDEALKICEKFNHAEAIIAIEERMGRAEEAMLRYLERFEKKGYLSKLSYSSVDRDISTFDRLYQKIRETPSGEARITVLSSILEKLSVSIPYGVAADVRQRFVDYLVKVTLDLLESDLSYSEENIKRVENLIAKISYNLTFGDLQAYLYTVLKNIRFSKTVWNEYDSLSIVDDWRLDFTLIIEKQAGTKSSNHCISCKKRLNFNIEGPREVIVFDCKHGYHIDCIEKNACPFCASLNKLDELRLTERKHSRDILDLNKLIQLNAELVSDSIQGALDITDKVMGTTTDVNPHKVVPKVHVRVCSGHRKEPWRH
jgi:predicted transcriptional regulator